LQHDLQHAQIKTMTSAHLIGIKKRYAWYDQEMKEGDTAKSLLLEMARQPGADIMVTGYHGRKGQKEDPTIMGSAVNFMAVNAPVPVLIIKDAHTRDQKPDGYRYAVCCDGSDQSLKALHMACKLHSKKDHISVLICEQDNIDSKLVKEEVEHDLEELNCHNRGESEVKILKSQPGRKASEIIREYLLACNESNTYIDIVLVGNKGADFSSYT
jgi:hypothetical protein